MTRLLSALVLLAWGLWLGGLVALFATLGTIFNTPGFDRETQGAFASRLFPVFERMQLVFAAVALLATTAWWFVSRRRVKLVLFWLFAGATIAAVVEAALISPRVEAMRVKGLRETPEFARMHQLSSRVYMGGAVVLLVAGFVLPSAIRSDCHSAPPSDKSVTP